jgi:hypothetical protein
MEQHHAAYLSEEVQVHILGWKNYGDRFLVDFLQNKLTVNAVP